MNAPPEQSKFQPDRSRGRRAGLYSVGGRLVDRHSPEFRAEANRQAALLDHSRDEREAAELMVRLAQEVWDREP